MRLRTDVEAQDHIDQEFAWRFKEIMDLKLQVRRTTGDRQKTLIRSGVPLLYAHWEGFVKASAECLINYVSHQPLLYKELAPCFVVRSLREYISELTSSDAFERTSEGVSHLLRSLDQPADLSRKSPVSTKSNLNSKRFEELSYSVGIDPQPYAGKRHFIDTVLLDRRNKIAHGEYLDLTNTEFGNLCEEVVVLLRQFKNDVENSISLKKYLSTLV